MKKHIKGNPLKKVLIIVLVIESVLIFGAFKMIDDDQYAQVLAMYDATFQRVDTKLPFLKKVEDFQDLKVEECTFPSNNGQKIAGYKYYKDHLDPKGVLIIAHGLGLGGQCAYMDTANFFASNGYLVFAYDVTGMDKSEGNSANGMEQGIIDLSYAINYVEHDNEMGKYPIALFGHSWGGYSVGAVLNEHPEVKAVVSVSGFNKPSEWYSYALQDQAGILLPYFEQIEKNKFGKYADYSAVDGFANTQAGIMIIQSKDDQNVPTFTGYDKYYERFKDDPRFTFKLYEDKGHLFIFYTKAARAYNLKFVVETTGQPTEYGKANMDSFDKKIGNEIDQDFYKNILEFLNKYL